MNSVVKNIWIKRVLLLFSLLFVYYLIASILVLTVSPTGPGSERFVYITLSIISLVAAYFAKHDLKYLLYFGATIFFVLFIYTLVERSSFRKKIEQQRDFLQEMQNNDNQENPGLPAR